MQHPFATGTSSPPLPHSLQVTTSLATGKSLPDATQVLLLPKVEKPESITPQRNGITNSAWKGRAGQDYGTAATLVLTILTPESSLAFF